MPRRADEVLGSRSSSHAATAALACWLAACGGGGTTPGVDGPPADAPGPQWWQPKVGAAKNWDIQLSGTIDLSAPRAMYDLDLWSLVPSATTLDYGDGTPVTVPAGSLPTAIADLHARTPPAIVICHVEVGLLELTRPDAKKFPGYKADPKTIPDNPVAPAPGTVTGNPAVGSVIGWSLGTADLRLLDARAATRTAWTPIMFKRFELAKQIGCDGIDPGHSDVVSYESGFLDMALDSYSWYADIAKQGHDRMLSTGMKNGTLLPTQVDMMADKFDWLMVERCGEFEDCDRARPFINLDKAVFAIDYNLDEEGTPQGSGNLCTQQALAMIADGIYKDVAVTSGTRTQCVP